jgi:hypothetical protein
LSIDQEEFRGLAMHFSDDHKAVVDALAKSKSALSVPDLVGILGISNARASKILFELCEENSNPLIAREQADDGVISFRFIQDGSVSEEVDYKKLYELAVSESVGTEFGKYCASLLVDKVIAIKAVATTDERYGIFIGKIEEMAAKGDLEGVLKLSEELRNIKSANEKRLSKIRGLVEGYSFEEVISAFPKELDALAHELALEFLNRSNRRPPRSGARTAG